MSRIYVAGGDHLIGQALLKRLSERGYTAVAGGDRVPDPTNPGALRTFFSSFRPEYVIIAGGESGGIAMNQQRPARLMGDNLGIAMAVIAVAHEYNVTKLLYVSSACGYPRDCDQPMRECDYFKGAVEPTSAAYAAAKFAGAELCRAYRREYGAPFVCAIPANEFGPGDNFESDDAHVIAALIRRMDDARQDASPSVTVWGTGEPVRDFIYAPDLADGLLRVLEAYDDEEAINVGSGTGCTIAEIAATVKEVVGYSGELVFDASKPDGMPRKVLDVSKLDALGWKPKTPLREAIAETYAWYRTHNAALKQRG